MGRVSARKVMSPRLAPPLAIEAAQKQEVLFAAVSAERAGRDLAGVSRVAAPDHFPPMPLSRPVNAPCCKQDALPNCSSLRKAELPVEFRSVGTILGQISARIGNSVEVFGRNEPSVFRILSFSNRAILFGVSSSPLLRVRRGRSGSIQPPYACPSRTAARACGPRLSIEACRWWRWWERRQRTSIHQSEFRPDPGSN